MALVGILIITYIKHAVNIPTLVAFSFYLGLHSAIFGILWLDDFCKFCYVIRLPNYSSTNIKKMNILCSIFLN